MGADEACGAGCGTRLGPFGLVLTWAGAAAGEVPWARFCDERDLCVMDVQLIPASVCPRVRTVHGLAAAFRRRWVRMQAHTGLSEGTYCVEAGRQSAVQRSAAQRRVQPGSVGALFLANKGRASDDGRAAGGRRVRRWGSRAETKFRARPGSSVIHCQHCADGWTDRRPRVGEGGRTGLLLALAATRGPGPTRAERPAPLAG